MVFGFVSLSVDALDVEGEALLAVDANRMKLSEDVLATSMVMIGKIVVTGIVVVEVREVVVVSAAFVEAGIVVVVNDKVVVL